MTSQTESGILLSWYEFKFHYITLVMLVMQQVLYFVLFLIITEYSESTAAAHFISQDYITW